VEKVRKAVADFVRSVKDDEPGTRMHLA